MENILENYPKIERNIEVYKHIQNRFKQIEGVPQEQKKHFILIVFEIIEYFDLSTTQLNEMIVGSFVVKGFVPILTKDPNYVQIPIFGVIDNYDYFERKDPKARYTSECIAHRFVEETKFFHLEHEHNLIWKISNQVQYKQKYSGMQNIIPAKYKFLEIICKFIFVEEWEFDKNFTEFKSDYEKMMKDEDENSDEEFKRIINADKSKKKYF